MTELVDIVALDYLKDVLLRVATFLHRLLGQLMFKAWDENFGAKLWRH